MWCDNYGLQRKIRKREKDDKKIPRGEEKEKRVEMNTDVGRGNWEDGYTQILRDDVAGSGGPLMI